MGRRSWSLAREIQAKRGIETLETYLRVIASKREAQIKSIRPEYVNSGIVAIYDYIEGELWSAW